MLKQNNNRMSKEHLIPYKPGQSGNPNSRPRKYVSLLKEQGYKLAEINDTIQAMMSMDLEKQYGITQRQRYLKRQLQQLCVRV